MTQKPQLVFDGNCGFCRLWVNYWRRLTGNKVEYTPSKETAPQAVQLVLLSGRVLKGAHAVFRLLAFVPSQRIWLVLYHHLPGFASAAQWFYNFIADHRHLAFRVTRFLWGAHLEPPSHILTRALFLRVLGLIYLIAFLSFAPQLPGLIGSDGILPAQDLLQKLEDNRGLERYWLAPTLAWFNTSDAFLLSLPIAGAVLAVLLIIGLAPIPVLILLWLLYLSLVTVGQVFMSFQWDILLLEVGFLAIFLAPWQLLPRLSKMRPPAGVIIWLYRFLLFRLMFSSGAVKLVSGDPTWHNLTALTYHYETQPIPNLLAWYFHQFPVWFQKFSTASALTIEIVVPFLIFAPRRARLTGAAVMTALQVLILLTGNYTFFNFLALALLLLLLDDALLKKLIPRRLSAKMSLAPRPARTPWPKRVVITTVAVLLILLGSIRLSTLVLPNNAALSLNSLTAWSAPLRLVNHYGLFAVMTTERPEIIIQGSHDGQNWQTYQFKYKPGDLSRRPPQVAPHQPRLDWQMWFAALTATRAPGSVDFWLAQFMQRLLQGSPSVLALLDHNPFPEQPPEFLRATLYDYHFTDTFERRRRDTWWRRTRLGTYIPAITLKEFK